jgi:zinc transport system substrate-binding protein
VLRLLALVLSLAAALACGVSDATSPSARPSVVAALYPLAWAAARVAGPDAEVTNLTPPRVEPHDAELSPQQVVAVTEADLVLYVGGGFQPALEDVARDLEGRAVDVLSVASEAGSHDPHVWLDPVAMAAVSRLAGARLGDVDPDDAGPYARRAASLARALQALNRGFRGGLRSCRSRVIVTSHEAFGHLARRYGLTEVGIAGLDPENEPTPQRAAEVTALARRRGVTTIFFERLVSPRIAQTIADELGIRAAVLDPLEAPPNDMDYLGAMRDNLDALRAALRCV